MQHACMPERHTAHRCTPPSALVIDAACTAPMHACGLGGRVYSRRSGRSEQPHAACHHPTHGTCPTPDPMCRHVQCDMLREARVKSERDGLALAREHLRDVPVERGRSITYYSMHVRYCRHQVGHAVGTRFVARARVNYNSTTQLYRVFCRVGSVHGLQRCTVALCWVGERSHIYGTVLTPPVHRAPCIDQYLRHTFELSRTVTEQID